ncbi:hypothetical protein OCH239_05060 [Roseivivax halodurans JCM 10272]|uniref:Uncharacterized protein n=1 Tax=Roseivivax halodurans JCM 10272 TaxID=1449350 RepID=X7EDQ6_9RHOB|nr:hypothetical protein [Roseivivax halodurans]ETX14224.1 hypothetical protein OCH239_05060 [Roseivivax halodurans JCM 10272]
MQITMPAPPAAPLVSGHPLGVPDAERRLPDPRRVEAAAKSEAADMAANRRLAASPDEELEAVLKHPAKHVAPPSIMQLRIAALQDGGSAPETAAASDEARSGYGRALDRP